MTFFRDFTVPLWKIVGGNLLLLVSIVFYIAWWIATFHPNRTGKATGAGIFLALALLPGVAAILIISSGIGSLSQAGKGFSVIYILLGAAVFYIILLAVTKIAFQRPVTSELLLITIWAALEGSAIAVLQGSNRFIMAGFDTFNPGDVGHNHRHSLLYSLLPSRRDLAFLVWTHSTDSGCGSSDSISGDAGAFLTDRGPK